MKKKGYIYFIVVFIMIALLGGCSGDSSVQYTLEISVEGEGTVNPSPGKHQISEDTTVTLSVNPEDGYEFDGWAGPDGDRVSAENKVVVSKDMKITAVFTPLGTVAAPQFSVAGGTYTGPQSVTISCGTEEAEIYYITGDNEPSADNGTLYSGAITINDDTTLKAIAVKEGMTDSSITTTDYIINYSLDLTASPSGGGSITADPDNEFYKYEDNVELTVSANSGYSFSNWSGDLSGSVNPGTLTIDSNKTVTAVFTSLETVAAPQFSVAGGTYTGPQSVTISCGTEEAEIYYITGDNEPSADNGTLYSGAITINDDTTLKAIAVKEGMTDSSITTTDYIINYSLDLTTSPSGGGSITADPDNEFYKYEDNVELTVSANSGYSFSNWSGDLSGADNPATVTMDENKSITAQFTADEYNVFFTVLDEAEAPLEGATVSIEEQDNITDVNGETSFSLSAGTYSYTVSFNNFQQVSEQITVVNQDINENVVLYYYALNAAELTSAFGESSVAVINLTSSEYDLSTSTCTVDGTKTLKSANSSTVYLNIDQDYSNITTRDHVTMKHLANGDLTTNINRSLGLETIINGDLIITAGTLDINSQNVSVSGSILQRGGTLNVNKGVVDVDSDLIIEEEDGSGANAILQMTDPADYITVGGNFLMDSNWSHSDKLTAGTLEIKGNFTREYNSHSSATYSNFDTSDTHRVILSGSDNQTVNFAGSSSGSSCFANLELNNTGTLDFATKSAVTGDIINKMSTAPANITNLYPAGTATINSGLSNEGEWLWDMGIHENWTLTQDVDINGDYYLLGNCTVNPGGYTMNIGGNFYQRKGTLDVNGGVVNITGDYIIEEEDESCAVAYLQMTDAADYIMVGGNFIMHSQYSSNNLSAGILEVKGDFTQKHKPMSTSANENFNATGNHKVILSGSSQSVSFAKPHSTQSCFANLELNNTGTLEFASRAAVTGNIINDMSTVPTNITNLYPAGTATINSGLSNEGEWPGDMGIYENWTLQHDVTVEGDLYIFSGTINEDIYTLTVNGNTIN